ncbi:hypothetical protein CRUP_019191 [Coryphaenoides rupestris]|nr:hypothetical protein CRUP_019191 [Coryphaenoides rupestris]
MEPEAAEEGEGKLSVWVCREEKLTKILRLWSAWGDEQENVRFVLVKNDASLPNTGPRSGRGPARRAAAAAAAARTPAPARRSTRRAAAGGGLLKPGANLSQQQDKQRRVVRKAFRKLDKMNKDHTIRQQVHRLKEVDREDRALRGHRAL